MKLLVKDVIKYQGTFLILIEYPQTDINLSKSFDVLVNDEKIAQISGLKEMSNVPMSAATGLVLSTKSNLRSLLKYNPRKINVCLTSNQNETKDTNVEHKYNKENTSQKKINYNTNIFLDEKPSKT